MGAREYNKIEIWPHEVVTGGKALCSTALFYQAAIKK
jgi:hypothetical protein